jgi:hypothetical protein
MAYNRPNPPLEMNPDSAVFKNALVWALGTSGSMTSLGRAQLTMGTQGTVTTQTDSVTVPQHSDQSRLYVNAEASHNSEVFTRIFVFDRPASQPNTITLFASSDADTNGGYTTGALLIRCTSSGALAVIRSNQAAVYVGPDNQFQVGTNVLAITRLADKSMRFSINGATILTVPTSDYIWGRNAFGAENPRDGENFSELKLRFYAQDNVATEDAYLISLATYPTQMVRTVGSTAEPVPGIPATAISVQGMVPVWQIGKASPPLSFSLNGDITSNVTITPSAPNVTFNPATVVLTPTQKTGSTVPTASAPGTVTVTTTNNAGLTNPPNFTVELANDISRTVTTIQELKDAAAWAKTLNLTSLQQNAYIRLAANLTLNSSTGGVTFEALSASADYRVIIEPNAGQDHSTLQGTGAYNYGTLGRELTLSVDGALVLKNGAQMRKMRSNITAGGGINFAPGGSGPRPSIDECKVLCNAADAIKITAYLVG